MNGPVLLIVGPLAAAVVAWLLGRWPRFAAAAGALLAWGLAFWLWRLPFPEEVEFYGRSLSFTVGIQSLFVLLLVLVGGLSLLLLLWPQGRGFLPTSLAVLSPLAAALVVQPLTLSALFWFMVVIGFGVIIQSGQAGQTQGAWRYVLLMFLAVLLLLVGGWLADTAQAAYQTLTSQLLAVAFLILLAGFPFHIWVQPVVNAGRGLVWVLVLGLGQFMLIIWVYEWLAAYPWLGQAAEFRQLVQWGAVLTALTAGLLALTAPSMLRLLGSLLLLDMSFGIALLLVPAEAGWETAVLLPLSRTISLLLVALAGYSQSENGQVRPDWQGLDRRQITAVLLLAYGLLSLLGLPLTLGFPGRWTAVALIANNDNISLWLPVGLLLAMGGGILGVWRNLAPSLKQGAGEIDSSLSQPAWLRIGLVISLLAGMGLAVLPFGVDVVHRLAVLWLSIG